MEERIFEYSGRKFSEEDMAIIVETTQTYPKLSQKEIASTICELIGWVSTGGRPKTVQCVGFLRKLEQEGRIKLPQVMAKYATRKSGASNSGNRSPVPSDTDMSEITECRAVELEIVRPGGGLARWRGYISNYHRLGDPQVLGNQLRYMIKSEGRDLGCLLFSASSWALAPREEWIGWTAEDKKSRLHLVLNNSRFLLLPWVRVNCLASRSLSMVARRIQRDWIEEYCYAPVLLETFVDSPYRGTSYKASNWIYLGETKGRGRNDRYNEKALTQKAIYVMPLQRDFREVLRGEKPWKAVEPHV